MNVLSNPLRSVSLAACLAALFGGVAARADVIFDSFDPGGGFHPQFNLGIAQASRVFGLQLSAHRGAVRFEVPAGSFELESITIPMSQALSGTSPSLQIRIAADNAGVPGAILETLAENASVPPAGTLTMATVFPSAGRPRLGAGLYWVIVEVTNQPPSFGSTSYRWHYSNAGPILAYRRQDSVGTLPADPWSGFSSTERLALRVNASPISTCCNPTNGACTILSTAACAAAGLTALPTGAVCSPATCPARCPADFNASGGVGIQDLFDFLAAYFAGC